jgi:hypothetical protein
VLNNNNDYLDKLRDNQYDFIDFGCSSGGSIEYYQKMFGAKGLGIDIDPKKVKSSTEKGFNAIVCDITKIELEKKISFGIMSHFLEHISSIKHVKIIVEKACSVINEFLIIRQPYFDADHYLFTNGFKFYWSDWTGHPNHMTLLEFYNILKPLKDSNLLKEFSFYGLNPVIDSNNDAIHNLDSPTDQHHWNK